MSYNNLDKDQIQTVISRIEEIRHDYKCGLTAIGELSDNSKW